MKNVIIGTAGHIDHGKTTLIKALTGRDTDRLKEEKQRGISIELGFTYFDLPSGRRAGIIDVPGHEKFIRNMLAGAIGIDIVVLVVAADEGVMPQTKEHLDILNLLGTKKGAVAITKTDLVDEDWLQLVILDIKEHLKGSFLEDSPIIPVSSTNKQGIDKLINLIDKLTEEIEERDIDETPRLPIDRSFIMAGFGTVVTGTLLSGKLHVGDEIQIYPGEKRSKIRNLQVHGRSVEWAYAGQRVAVNLSGIKKNEVKRGDVIAPVDAMKATTMLDVKLNLLKDSQRIIENGSRLRLYIGTSEVMCRAILLDCEQLTPGESSYVQLRLEEEIAVKKGDKFIVRFYSPMTTLGGGEVVEPNPPKRKRYDNNTLKELELKEKGDFIDIVENIIIEKSNEFPSVKELSIHTVTLEEKIAHAVDKLSKENRVIIFTLMKDIHVIHKKYYDTISNDIVKTLEVYHKKNPLKPGMLKEELRSRFLKNIKSKLGELFIDKLIEDNIVKQINEFISLKDFEIQYTDIQHKIKDKILKEYLDGKFSPLKIQEIFDKLKLKDREAQQVFDSLINFGLLVKLKEDIILHKEVYLEAIDTIKKYIRENGAITVAQLRDILNTNRKYAIALLEYLDQQKITKRVEDKRILF